ncbi:similar to An12g07180 [Aspergillus luchuensis]|uniref:Similar to An12g07180 n=1 Tax=Aspergillus kawachii TaxID=1069201 RepID=A0A146F2Y6_ASPKA|nr:similar to An12g07180 [Aspergillus luchuensis]
MAEMRWKSVRMRYVAIQKDASYQMFIVPEGVHIVAMVLEWPNGWLLVIADDDKGAVVM